MTNIRVLRDDLNFDEGSLEGCVFNASVSCGGWATIENSELWARGFNLDDLDGPDFEWTFEPEQFEVVDEEMEAHILKLESAPTADSILQAGLSHMEDRAATYDNDEGERSIPATVTAFNAITGHELTAEAGWLFMSVLKMVRSQQGEFKLDNYEDLAAYAGLMGEQAAKDRGAA